jgi:hypothetical protein
MKLLRTQLGKRWNPSFQVLILFECLALAPEGQEQGRLIQP